MKDIFIDNDCASKHFASPVDPHYKELIIWLSTYKTNSEENAFLVVSNKLIREYHSSCRGAISPSSMPVLLDKLTREGRLIKYSNKEIDGFMTKVFSKKVCKKLRSNKNDWPHISIVLMSNRNMALSEDEKLLYDLINFAKYKVIASRRPEQIPYK